MFSVDTEDEAKRLIIATCSYGSDGHYYATELMESQTLENLERFATKLERVHEIMKERGTCKCQN